jgi:hypothetical protein
VSAAIEEESRPRNGLGESGHFAKHDLDDMPDGISRVLGSAATAKPPIDEQLKEIESQHPEKQDGQ